MIWVLAAIVGAALCTVGDHLHVVNGVLKYPHPMFWRQAWWVPFIFAGASLAAVAAARSARRLFRGRPYPTGLLLADAVAFFTAYAFTAYAHTLPNVVLGALSAAFLARVLGRMSGQAVVLALVAAVVGPAFEAGWSRLGFFDYLHPDFAGVPRWLPALYLHVGPLAASFARLAD
jgi:hypothetical protein